MPCYHITLSAICVAGGIIKGEPSSLNGIRHPASGRGFPPLAQAILPLWLEPVAKKRGICNGAAARRRGCAAIASF